MSSRRFPGKVLAPFRGRPLIEHVVEGAAQALYDSQLLVLTSNEPSDDPLVHHLNARGVPVFRGALLNVYERFRSALALYPCDWVLRICADSPVLNGRVLRAVADAAHNSSNVDLVTTISPRTLPTGHNAEIIRTSTFLGISDEELLDHEREHVTQFFHRHPERFRLLNIGSDQPELAKLSYVVDTVEDLNRLEHLAPDEIRWDYVLEPRGVL